MLSPRLLILFFRKESLLDIFMWLMGFGILILLDSLGTVWIASLIGAYIAVALVGIMTWVSLIILFASLYRHIKVARTHASKATATKQEFRHICGLLICAVLIVTPGLITDIMAWLVYIPPIRLLVGRFVVNANRDEFEQLHQHLSVDEL